MRDPMHTHDCDGCAYLGHVSGEDVYHCDHIDLIRRYGSLGHEYHSFPISIARNLPDARWKQAVAMYDAYVLGAAHGRMSNVSR